MKTEQRVSRWIKTHGYGLSERAGHNFVNLHETGTDDDKEFVESLLTNLNFHTACMCLKKRDYSSAHFQFVKD